MNEKGIREEDATDGGIARGQCAVWNPKRRSRKEKKDSINISDSSNSTESLVLGWSSSMLCSRSLLKQLTFPAFILFFTFLTFNF